MAGDPRPRPRFAAADGFTPQAKHLSPLCGSQPPQNVLEMCVIERRRRDRFIAWGVSPRERHGEKPSSPEGAAEFTRGVSRGFTARCRRCSAKMTGRLPKRRGSWSQPRELSSLKSDRILLRCATDGGRVTCGGIVRAGRPHHKNGYLVVQPSRLHKSDTTADRRRDR
jgi:hypothetical protein